jgi:hypothetical protein
MKRCLLCLFLVPATFATIGLTDEKKPASQQLPGDGIADPDRKIGFFPGKTGGIDALDLATGKLLWTSVGGTRPLLATADRVYAQTGDTNQVRVIAIDSASGKLTLESQPIKLADWVSVKAEYGRSFSSSAKVEGKALYLSWQARAFYAGGARPTPEIEKAARKEASGVARVDLETGKIEVLEKDKAAKFPVTGEVVNPKVGNLTLTAKVLRSNNAKNPFEQKQMLQAMNESNQMVWQYEIKAPVFLPPRP